MSNVVNLNKARKAKAAVDKAARADANRAKFGRTKAQKQADGEAGSRIATLLDQAKRED